MGSAHTWGASWNSRKGCAWLRRLLANCRWAWEWELGHLTSLPLKSICEPFLLRHTRASSVSPLTRTNGSRSTQPPWWLPTRASGAPRPRLISMQWRIMPTTTCCAVRAAYILQLQGGLCLGLPSLPSGAALLRHYPSYSASSVCKSYLVFPTGPLGRGNCLCHN